MKKPFSLLVLIVAAAMITTSVSARRGDSYVFFANDDLSISGDFGLDTLGDLRDEIEAPFLWVRKDGREWVVRDYATLERFRSISEPLDRFMEVEYRDLEAEESRLDEIEEALDEEEDRLDDLAEDLDDEAEENERWTSEMREREREIEEKMRRLESRHRELEREMRDLESKERELDRREEELEREVEGKLWDLINESIRNGTAVPKR